MENASTPIAEQRPLLAFPSPTTGKIPKSAKRKSNFRAITAPSASRQRTRLLPQFNALHSAVADKRAQLAESTVAPDPELVAVFDLAGTVDDFLRATSKIKGLEFLDDLQNEYVEPDDDFYFESDGLRTDELIPQSLYMVMTNAQAITELIRLFNLWRGNTAIKLPQGLNPFKQVFSLLRGIRPWEAEDRIRETGLLEQWREDVEVVGAQGVVRVEIELWFRQDEESRRKAENQVRRVLEGIGAETIAASQHPAIAYHAILATIPMSEVERVLSGNLDTIELLTTDSIMMVSPSRSMVLETTDPTNSNITFNTESLPTGLPRIALLDGVPLATHVALNGRLVIDDPDNYTDKYATAERRHGTAMASLIAHGDLAVSGQAALPQPIYVRPIYQPHPMASMARHAESVPTDVLLVDLIHRCFHRIFEGDGIHKPASPSVRIVTLAVGDPTRMFVRRLSPLAKLLDWMAHLYNVVIVVSGGNQVAPRPKLDIETLKDGNSVEIATAQSLYESARHRRLLSPAEAVNVITVGALHSDSVSRTLPDTVLDPLPYGSPAAYSPVGFGFRRSVKPEVMLAGGRQVFLAPTHDQTEGVVELQPATSTQQGPGLQTASPGLSGQLDAVTHSAGTSNSTALAARSLSQIMELLSEIRTSTRNGIFPDAQYDPVLAKTLLVHAAGWHDSMIHMRDLLGLSRKQVRSELTKLMGYGPVRSERWATAERTRVVLIGAGSISKGDRHKFKFPLPSSLAATTEWRRLTITLAWLSPINVRSQKYRMARLRFLPSKEDLAVTPTEADHNAVFKGTVQHQIFEGTAAVGYVPGSNLEIDVDCRVDAGNLKKPVRYGLAASLEVATTVSIDLHAEVQAQLQAELLARAIVR